MRLGPYALLDEIGRGGMGAVYRAEHVATGAIHAVKVMTPQTAEDALRFLREAEGMARVEGHPHILRIHASGQEQGRLWLAMEWAPGGSLADRLAAGPLPVDALAPLGRALALGLAHVHTRGVLHRDLKPANVLFDASGAPKLADFGVARLRDARSLTQTGTVVGTPAYMAPEQVLASSGVDERADLYGLGAVLYHAATGRPPFEGRSALALLEAVTSGTLADPRRLRPDLPDWLARELLRALSREPDDRHPSARALAAALEGGKPATASRRAPLAAAGALALLVLLFMLGRGVATPSDPAAVTSAPPAAVRSTAPAELDPEAALNAGEPQRALDAVGGADGDDARWVRIRALVMLDRSAEASAALASVPRERRELAKALVALGALHDELEQLKVTLTAVRATTEQGHVGDLLFDVTVVPAANPYALLAGALERLRALRPDRVGEAAGTTGQVVTGRLSALLASLFPDLLRLLRDEEFWRVSVDRAALIETLRLLVAAAPDAPAARSLSTVALWLDVLATPPKERAPGDVEALARAAEDSDVEAPYRRLAALGTLEHHLSLGSPLDVLLQSEGLLGPTPPTGDPLLEIFRRAAENLGERYAHLAWSQRARRADVLARLDGLLARTPASSFHDAHPRLRIMAGLLSGREPSQEELASVRATTFHHAILQAEVSLGRSEWAAAARHYRTAAGRVGRGYDLIDPWTGLALALTLDGDHAGASEALEHLTTWPFANHWLPWRRLADTKAAIAKARAGTWAPTPGRPFPPD